MYIDEENLINKKVMHLKSMAVESDAFAILSVKNL